MTTSIFSLGPAKGASSVSLSVLRSYVTSDRLYRFTVFGVKLGGSDLPAFTVRARTPLFPEGTFYAKAVLTEENGKVRTEEISDPYSIFYLERIEADFIAATN